MGSQFQKRFTQPMERLLTDHGVSVVFEMDSATVVVIQNAFVSEEETEDRNTETGPQRFYIRNIRFSTDAENARFSAIADPKFAKNGKVTVDGKTYQISKMNRDSTLKRCEMELVRYGIPRGVNQLGFEGGN